MGIETFYTLNFWVPQTGGWMDAFSAFLSIPEERDTPPVYSYTLKNENGEIIEEKQHLNGSLLRNRAELDRITKDKLFHTITVNDSRQYLGADFSSWQSEFRGKKYVKLEMQLWGAIKIFFKDPERIWKKRIEEYITNVINELDVEVGLGSLVTAFDGGGGWMGYRDFEYYKNPYFLLAEPNEYPYETLERESSGKWEREYPKRHLPQEWFNAEMGYDSFFREAEFLEQKVSRPQLEELISKYAGKAHVLRGKNGGMGIFRNVPEIPEDWVSAEIPRFYARAELRKKISLKPGLNEENIVFRPWNVEEGVKQRGEIPEKLFEKIEAFREQEPLIQNDQFQKLADKERVRQKIYTKLEQQLDNQEKLLLGVPNEGTHYEY